MYYNVETIGHRYHFDMRVPEYKTELDLLMTCKYLSHMTKYFLIVGLIALSLLAISSCGHRHQVGEEQLESGQVISLWETTWVDPQVILSDSMFTLIRADRVDSFMVTNSKQLSPKGPSISFTVRGQSCRALVSLLDARDRLIRPLLAQSLRPGYYKLTLDFSRCPYETIPRGQYHLKASTCGQANSAVISRD